MLLRFESTYCMWSSNARYSVSGTSICCSITCSDSRWIQHDTSKEQPGFRKLVWHGSRWPDHTPLTSHYALACLLLHATTSIVFISRRAADRQTVQYSFRTHRPSSSLPFKRCPSPRGSSRRPLCDPPSSPALPPLPVLMVPQAQAQVAAQRRWRTSVPAADPQRMQQVLQSILAAVE